MESNCEDFPAQDPFSSSHSESANHNEELGISDESISQMKSNTTSSKKAHLKCFECNLEFVKASKLKRHIQNVH